MRGRGDIAALQGPREGFRRVAVGYFAAAPAVVLALAAGGWRAEVPLAMALHVLLFAPSLVPNSALFGPVVRRFHPVGREIWLTIDDGPAPEATPQVLELLARWEARATFFVIGDRARRHPQLVRAMAAGGHAVGNHTAAHDVAGFWAAPPYLVADEIDRCNGAVAAATGGPAQCFRAPVGLANLFVHPQLRRRGMTMIGWTLRAYDAGATAVDRIVRRVVGRAEPGAILVLHPEVADRAGGSSGLAILDGVLRSLAARGYRFVVPPPERWRG